MRKNITSSVLNYFYIIFLEASAFFWHPGDLSIPSLPGTSRGESLQRGGGSISGLCTLPGAGWEGGGCGLGGGFALHLCLEPGFPADAKGFALGCWRAGEEGFPSLRRAAGAGKGQQMERLEEHRVAAARLSRDFIYSGSGA